MNLDNYDYTDNYFNKFTLIELVNIIKTEIPTTPAGIYAKKKACDILVSKLLYYRVVPYTDLYNALKK